MTETVGAPAVARFPSRLAVMNTVRQNHCSNGASQRLANVPRPRAENGARMRPSRVTARQPASRKRLRTSDEANQLFSGCCDLRPINAASERSGRQSEFWKFSTNRVPGCETA
jgi:hypothetical protein